jgi:signal transduction histidine kinase
MSAPDDPAFEHLVNQIAHDVRNHAFTMGLQAEMGQRRTADAPEVKAHFDAILRQVDSLRRYLEQLLLFGRPVAAVPGAVDPVALAHSEVERLRRNSEGGAGLELRVEGAEGGKRGHWDERLLRHALRALLENAVESAAPPPPVVVAVRDAGDYAEIEVRDAGAGIAPDALDRMTVPMAVRRPGGAGLGVAIARKMVQAHGGCLEIESSPRGTTARLVVPWEAPNG